MNKPYSRSRIALTLLSLALLFTITFTSVWQNTTPTVYAQDAASDTPTPADIVTETPTPFLTETPTDPGTEATPTPSEPATTPSPTEILPTATLEPTLELTPTEILPEDFGGMNAFVVTSPVQLNVPYIDQVYVQYKKDGIRSPAYWNWCGAVSTAMALKFFGADTRDDVTASYDAFQNIYDSVNGNLYSRIPAYTAKFGVTTVIHYGAPTFTQIKAEIDAGRPIIMHNSLGGGHFFLLVGYGETDKVIVHDPFGNTLWGRTSTSKTNAPLVFNTSGQAVAQTNGRYVVYSMTQLKSIFKNDWESFTNNPIPRVTSLSPANVTVGSGDISVTVTGSGFVKGAVARWNGNKLPTSYVSSTQLKVTLAAGLFKSGTTAGISVFNHLPGGGVSNNAMFTVNNPKPTTKGLSHRVIAQTGPDLTITVNGTGFVPTSKVRWGSATLATTYVSSTQVQAIIPSALRKGVGGVTITVFNPTPAGGTSNSQTLAKADFYAPLSILSKHSGKAIDLADGSTADGAKIQQWAWARNDNQKWYMVPTGVSNEYWIVSAKSLKCLTMTGTGDGAALTQQTCSFGSSQRFTRISRGTTVQGTYYALKSSYSLKLLDVRDWSTADGAVIQQYAPAYGNNQLWYFKQP